MGIRPNSALRTIQPLPCQNQQQVEVLTYGLDQLYINERIEKVILTGILTKVITV